MIVYKRPGPARASINVVVESGRTPRSLLWGVGAAICRMFVKVQSPTGVCIRLRNDELVAFEESA